MSDYIYHKRDISWLSFNHRVLQEAADPNVPLYERIKFLAIYSSNLDEFYRVRVSALRQFKKLDKSDRKELLDYKPKKELKEIQRIVHQQQSEFGSIFRDQILPLLEANSIYLLKSPDDFSDHQKEFAKQYFQQHILSHVQRYYLHEEMPPPFLQNQALYLLATLKGSARLGMVTIPSKRLQRFVTLPSDQGVYQLAFLDDIIRYNLQFLFEEPVAQIYSIKLSRDAELYIDDEFSGDLMEKIKSSLDQRDTGLPTRLLYDSALNDELVDRLRTIFQLKKNDLFPGGRYHNFSDFFGFPDPSNNPGFRDEPLPPLPHPVFETSPNLITSIRNQDQVLHFPYQEYKYVPQLIRQAAEDPEVQSIKITLYRVASKSEVVQALLYGLEKGKKVTAFIEAKARFDEASNIYWGKELEEAGARVIYSYPGIKVHTKLLLLTFPKADGMEYLTYVGTGNFNEKTARLYGDHALFTARTSFGKEVNQVFGLLERRIVIPKNKELFISPFNTRQRFVELIDQEIENAKAGKEAYMILKMNSLEDTGMIDKLYEASKAGVRIQLIVRGICCLVAGVPGISDNIEVISIIDRFLEHARIYVFCNGGQEVMYTASADWMSRNLDRRIEVAVPIYDTNIYKELRDILTLQLQDNTKARLITQELDNPYRTPKSDTTEPVRAQTATYNYLKSKYSSYFFQPV